MGISGGSSSLARSPFDTVEFTDKTFTPLWSNPDFDNEKEMLKWLNSTVDGAEDYYREYFQVCQDNLLLFRGIQWIQQDRYANRWLDRQGVLTRRSPRVVINHLYDFVEQWVSRLTRYRPSVAIFPTTSEQEDADNSKIAKHVLDHIWYTQNIDATLQTFVRNMKIFGEGFLKVGFNPTKGDIHPDWAQAQKRGRVPVIGKDGQPLLNTKNEPLYIDRAVRIGDIEYENLPPWRVFEMPCRSRGKIDWTIIWDVEDIDYLKAKYPDKADEIKSDNGGEVFSNYRLDVSRLRNQVVTYELFHRSTEFLDKGRYIKFTKTAILENSDLPYSHGGLPYLHMADIQITDQTRGMSFFQQLFPLQHQINACASLIYKSLVLFAHPKWVMQDGSCDINQLLNESTIISYSGGVPPKLEVHPTVSGELFSYLDKLEQTASKLSGIFTMSRGEAPSGVRAAKALRVLEEQEDKRAYITTVKYNQIGLIDNAKMTLSVAGDFYDDTDNRLVRIVGRDNEYRIKRFQSANLSKPYDIRIENTTSLSNSASGRIEDIQDLSAIQVQPDGLLTKEQMVDILDLTADEQFKDITTRAYNCARSETQDILSGAPVKPPTEDEDLIVHWKTHLQAVQSREYKELLSEDRRGAMKEHLFITEYLMWKKGYGITNSMGIPMTTPSLAFQQQLIMNCPLWPVYFKIPAPGMQPMPPMGMGGAMGLPPQMGPMGEVPPSAAPVSEGVPLEGGAGVTPPPMPVGAPLV